MSDETLKDLRERAERVRMHDGSNARFYLPLSVLFDLLDDNARLTAELKTHMHLVRTMGGLLREGLQMMKEPIGLPVAEWMEKTERALAQGGSE